MHRKFQVGCPCCCPDCSIYTAGPFSDLTGYTTVDGTWAVASGAVYATAAPATLICDTEATSSNMQITPALRISTGKSGAVLCWKDSSNYLYAWFKRDGIFGPYSIGLTEVIGGVATDLATESTNSAANGICALHYNGTFLARFGRQEGFISYYHWLQGTVSDPSTLGKKAGVKTDHTLNAAFEQIDGWTLKTSGLYCENCYCNLVQLLTWVDQLYFNVQGVDCGGYYYGPDEIDGYYVFDYEEGPNLCSWDGSDPFPRNILLTLGALSDSQVSLDIEILSSNGIRCYAPRIYLPATCGRIDAATVFATPIVLPLDFVTEDECDWSNAVATIGAA